MLRDFLTDKWILGGIAFVIVFSVACVWWYHYDTAPYRKADAESEELHHQSEISKKGSNTNSESGEAADVTPAESSTPTAGKTITETTDRVVQGEGSTQAQNETDCPAGTAEKTQTAETPEVQVSPFGFGPYPEVPEDYPSKVDWSLRKSAQAELLTRTLVKLWTDGEKNFIGGSTYKGKIYPHYYDTVYIGIKETKSESGGITRVTRSKSGPFVDFTLDDLEDPPPHIRILDLETSGIDPYQYLDLP